LRLLEFGPGPEIRTRCLNISQETKRRLNESLMLFFTSITRQSSTILAEQKLNINGSLENLRRMKSQAVEDCYFAPINTRIRSGRL